jgi:hypothetical protein
MSGGILGNVKIGPKQGMALQQFIASNPDVVNKFLDTLGKKEKV